jgi:hypothetical protein
MEFVPKRKDIEGFSPSMVDPKDWHVVFAALNHSNKDLSMEYLLPGDPFEEIIKKAAHEKPDHLVISNNGTATVNFYGARTGKKYLKISVKGMVWKKKGVNEITLE